MSESPYAVYVEDGAVHVQWSSRGDFVTLLENGELTRQFREPRGLRFTLNEDGVWPEPVDERVRRSA